MPYRIDLPLAGDDAIDRLIELGALDLERVRERAVAALMPDHVTPEEIMRALGVGELAVSSAEGRDAGSVWILKPRPVRVGPVSILPAHMEAEPGAIRLIDAQAFGTGLHPTTALCLEALSEAIANPPPDALLDVGTGSGVLALAALRLGVPRAAGIDIDGEALRVAAENAVLNRLEGRLRLARGGPDTIEGQWPLVVANVLAAPLIEMAPSLVRCIGHRGRLVLSGIPQSLAEDVDRAYRCLGMRRLDVKSRGGWIALVLAASW